MAKFIDVYSSLEFKRQRGSIGIKPEFKRSTRKEVLTWELPDEVQRAISNIKLNKMGIFYWNLCMPVLISDRPLHLEEHGGTQLIDGQHETCVFLASEEDDGLPTFVISHPPDASLKECLKREAVIFRELNVRRTKLSNLDILRAELVYDDPVAVFVKSVMNVLELTADRFGSDKGHAKEVDSFNQFYYAVKDDHEHNGLGVAKLKSGKDFWDQVYKKQNKLHGTAFRAICFIDRFITEGLANGKQQQFRQWCIDSIAREWSPKELVKGYSTFNSHRYILYRVIAKYNRQISNLNGRGAETIGPKTLIQAAETNPNFAHPDKDEWQLWVTGLTSVKA